MSHTIRPTHSSSTSTYRRRGQSALRRGFEIVVLASTLLVGIVISAPPSAYAVPPLATVNLRSAATFSVLSGASVGNTVTGPVTTLRGDLGVTIVDTITGFPPGVATSIHNADAVATQAMADLVIAFDDAAGRSGATPFAGDQIGVTLAAGLYHSGAAVTNTGVMRLDAANNADAVFIFQVGGALGMAAASEVKLINGAQASHVFWQVNAAVTLGAGAKFAGTIMALDAIGVGAGAVVNGRALAKTGAVALNSNNFYTTPPAVTITGGATASATTSTPTIAGATDLAAGQFLSLTVAGQTLAVLVQAGGIWSATTEPILNGTYPVVAAVADSQGNTATATQALTIDTTLPTVTIAGGTTVSTNDSTPTISGTTDEAAGTTVTVMGAGIGMTTLVQIGGTWNATPATVLADAIYDVSVAISDPAGNVGTDSQTLTVDTVAPGVTINGGATRLTSSSTPTITGTTTSDVAVGATVTATFATQTLTTTVQTGGTWSVTPAPVINGIHTLVVSVADTATNPGSATQSITVDMTLPLIAITGGSTASTSDPTPTIDGTTDAATGATVTITGAGSAMTALVQSGGTWNATPATDLLTGTYTITASVTDAAGNVGVATQSLSVDAGTTTTTTVVPTTTTTTTTVVPTTTTTTTMVPTTTTTVVPTTTTTSVQVVVDPISRSGFSAVTPTRLFDTRPGQSPYAVRSVPKHKIGGADELQVVVTDVAGLVPAIGVGAVSLNITVTNPDSDGFVTVYPCGTRELVSSVNYLSGQTVANAVISPVSAAGSVCIFSSAATDVIGDFNGWFPVGGVFTAIGPKRVFDTRADQLQPTLRTVTKAAIQPDTPIELRLTDLLGLVPEVGVSAVSLNVTVTNAAAAGFITVFDCGNRAMVSSVNFVADRTVANAVVAPVSASGAVCFYSSATTDIVVDINGWLSSGSTFTPVSPRRVADTRAGQSSNSLREMSPRQVGGDYVLEVKISDLPGVVPAWGVTAVSLNVTATDTHASGHITVYPCDARQDVSSLNYASDQTVANAVIAQLSPTGAICIYAQNPVDIVIDINGWFSASG
jgi:Ice-binding-like/Bacterial Ig-like domain